MKAPKPASEASSASTQTWWSCHGVIHFTQGDFPTRDAEARERELHIEFQHLQRFKRYGRGAEWFTSSPALLARIREIATEPEVLGLPRTFSAAENGQQT